MWYTFAKNESQIIRELDLKDLNTYVNGKLTFNEDEPETMESMIDPLRQNTVVDLKTLLEMRQPVRTKSTGIGAEYRLQDNKDWVGFNDNFINPSNWNTN